MDGRLNGAFLILQVTICRWIFKDCIHFLFFYLKKSGGGPVEIGSGIGGLAYSWVLGRRHERELLNFRPHNVSLVGLGSEPF